MTSEVIDIPSEARLVGYSLLPYPIIVSRECAGTFATTSIGGMPCTVWLPRLSDEPSIAAAAVLPPLVDGLSPSNVDSILEDDKNLVSKRDPHRWGHVAGGRSATYLQVHGVVLDFGVVALAAQEWADDPYFHGDWWFQILEGSQYSATGEIRKAVESWFALLEQWAPIIADQSLSEAPGWQETGNRIALHGFSDERTAHCHALMAVQIKVDPWTQESLPLAKWQHLLSLAGKDEPPVLELRILAEARRALHAKDYRRAVIEAAAAIELTLNLLLDQDLAAEDPEAVKAVDTNRLVLNKERRTLGVMFHVMKLYRPFHPALNDTIKLRNAVIHDYFTPTRAQTAQAVEASEATVGIGFPIPH